MKLIVFLSIVGLLMACESQNNNAAPPVPEAISLLGDSLYPRQLDPKVQEDFEKKLYDTRMAAKAHPDSEIALIWYCRRLAYLGHYKKAIEVYTKGLQKHPNSFKLLRHRGHRYITIREFDRAIADLSRAAAMAEGSAPEIEPDGLPNKLNQPLSTSQWNIYYHLGLAYYLVNDLKNSRDAFLVCYEMSDNDDVLVAASDWLYMIFRRMDAEQSAADILARIPENPTIIENDSYLKRIRMYQGSVKPEDLMKTRDDQDVSLTLATQGYGMANWYLYSGDTTKAVRTYEQILSGDNWPAFGYIAAEADYKRLISN